LICLLFGRPGCGKGTQGRLLSQWLGIPCVSTGALLRATADEALKQRLGSGGFAADEVVNELVRARLASGPAKLILDGYPRTIAQAVYFDSLMRELGLSAPVAIHFEVGAAVLMQRLADRRECSGCARVYNLRVDPPAWPDRCDDCQSPIERRDDDAIATVRRRLEIYESLTAPVVEHYRSGTFFDFDGDRPPVDVFAEVRIALGRK
jgi:adenylate kinase